MATGLPDLPGDLSRAASLPGTGIGNWVRSARNRISERSASARSNLGRIRKPLEVIENAGRPLRDFGRSVENARNQLSDLDRQLADEGVSEEERAEIRKALKGDEIDKVGGRIAKVNEVLDAPKKAVDKVENQWLRREEQITGPMDRFSSYADQRDRRLSAETGGSGDLFERMIRNRQQAAERRREARQQEERDQRRRERARDSARERRDDERRVDRRDER